VSRPASVGRLGPALKGIGMLGILTMSEDRRYRSLLLIVISFLTSKTPVKSPFGSQKGNYHANSESTKNVELRSDCRSASGAQSDTALHKKTLTSLFRPLFHWIIARKRVAVRVPFEHHLRTSAERNENKPCMKIDWLLEGPMASAAPWQAWWLILVSLAFLLALGACRWSRERVSAELRRFQSRIAADLHDDIGPSLSQIVIMSELAGQSDTPESAVLQEIACVSRDVLESLGEIVCALDTSQDPLHDLTERMRWFAGETLSAQGISLDFRASEPAAERRLSADARRQVFLIFKECMNNIARHADAAHAIIIWSGERDWIVLHIEDDGRGFDPQEVSRGYGLGNMNRRARVLGGQLETRSQPGRGTSLDLWIPIRRRRFQWASAPRIPHERIPHEHAGTTRVGRRSISAKA
jgi:signal transduction histidine kinase